MIYRGLLLTRCLFYHKQRTGKKDLMKKYIIVLYIFALLVAFSVSSNQLQIFSNLNAGDHIEPG